jgi:hypothetical protein
MDAFMFLTTVIKGAMREMEKYEKLRGLEPTDFSSDICRVSGLSSLAESAIGKQVKHRTGEFAGGSLYVILASRSRFPFTPDTIAEQMERCKKDGFRMSGLNVQNPWDTEAGEGKYCLQVGSGKGNVVKRLVQHLGIPGDDPRVSALHLAQWWPEAELYILIRHFTEKAGQYLRDIEAIIRDYYRPVFEGRISG